MSRAAERLIVIEPLYTEDGLMVEDRARVEGTLTDLLGTLAAVGGKIEVMADRVKVGEIPGQDRPTVIAETVGYIVRYTASAPLNASSITAAAMAAARRDDEPEMPETLSPAEALGGDGEDEEE
jgi:hypothetical protein